MQAAAANRRARAPAGRPVDPGRPWEALGLGAAVGVALLALQLLGAFAAVDEAGLDAMTRLASTGEPDPTVVLCGIERTGSEESHPWPWSRADLAGLVERLAAGGARVIVLDLDLGSATPAAGETDRAWEDEALAAAIAEAHNVVLSLPARLATVGAGAAPPPPKASVVLENESGPGSRFSVPQLGAALPALDLFRTATVAEGFVAPAGREARRRPLLASAGTGLFPSLGLAAAAAYEGRPARLSAVPGAARGKERPPRLRMSGEPVPVDARGALSLNFRQPPSRVSAAEVLAGRTATAELNDRLIFVGLVEEPMNASTQVDESSSSLALEATAAGNLLARSAIRSRGAPAVTAWLATLLAGVLSAGAAWWMRSRLGAALAVAGLALLWPVVSYAALTTATWHLPWISPTLAATVAGVAVLGLALVQRKRRRSEISALLAGAVPEATVEALSRDASALAASRRQATVMAVEISGVADLADRLAPQAFESALQRALAPLTAAVLGAGGTVESAGAEAIKAVFGAPLPVAGPEARACRAAAALRAEAARLKAALAAAAEMPLASSHPALELGIASGEMTVGVLAADGRARYTATGSVAALAPRLARLGRVYGVAVVVDETTASLAGGDFVLRELDRVRLRGQPAPIAIFELVAANPAPPNDRQRVVRYEAGLAALRHREFVRAERLFTSILEDLGEDAPARLMAERCRRLRASPPPEGWDGTAAYPHF